MPFLKRERRARIYYEVHGEGIPLLLSHGFSSTSGMWEGQIEPLTKAGYKLLIWDFRGHGRSAYHDEYTTYTEQYTVGDMEALLDHVFGPKSTAVIGGLSLGGYMSLAFYRDHPERVQALLIIDTGPGFKSDKARDEWNKYARETGDRFDREGLASLKELSPERSKVKHRNADGLALAARGMLTQKDNSVILNLPNIKVPSLIIVGSEDKNFLAAADYMAAKIPESEKVTIPDAGHASNMDQPQVFNEAMLNFLTTVKSKHGLKSKL